MDSKPVILLTGACDGIGKETAIGLAEAGATVIVHGRSEQRVMLARQELERAVPGGRFDQVAFDLASRRAICQGAKEVLRRHRRLDVLINNAGVYLDERRLTEDAHEVTFAVNYLAPFLLTRLLLPALLEAAPARVINLCSSAHEQGQIDFDDLDGAMSFNGYRAYSQSKLAILLFSRELARRIDPRRITVNAVHPGIIETKLLRAGFTVQGDSPARGAEPIVRLALSPTVAGVTGRYYSGSRDEAVRGVKKQVQRRLWQVSEHLLGIAHAWNESSQAGVG